MTAAEGKCNSTGEHSKIGWSATGKEGEVARGSIKNGKAVMRGRKSDGGARNLRQLPFPDSIDNHMRVRMTMDKEIRAME